MKRWISLLLVLAMTAGYCSGLAEAADEQKTGFFTGIGSWLDGLVDDAREAAESAAEWTSEHWEEVKGSAAELAGSAKEAAESAMEWTKSTWNDLWTSGSEAGTRISGTIGSWISDTWNNLKNDASERFSGVRESWNSFTHDAGELIGMIGLTGEIITRESLLETADFIEEKAAEQGIALPEDVKAALQAMRQNADKADGEAQVHIDDTVLSDFLPQLGLDKESFENALTERLKLRILKLGIQAESTALRAYMAQNGLAFSSQALRAQDRLERYAAGQLALGDDEISQAVEIIENWCKENGINEEELVLTILFLMEKAGE